MNLKEVFLPILVIFLLFIITYSLTDLYGRYLNKEYARRLDQALWTSRKNFLAMLRHPKMYEILTDTLGVGSHRLKLAEILLKNDTIDGDIVQDIIFLSNIFDIYEKPGELSTEEILKLSKELLDAPNKLRLVKTRVNIQIIVQYSPYLAYVKTLILIAMR